MHPGAGRCCPRTRDEAGPHRPSASGPTAGGRVTRRGRALDERVSVPCGHQAGRAAAQSRDGRPSPAQPTQRQAKRREQSGHGGAHHHDRTQAEPTDEAEERTGKPKGEDGTSRVPPRTGLRRRSAGRHTPSSAGPSGGEGMVEAGGTEHDPEEHHPERVAVRRKGGVLEETTVLGVGCLHRAGQHRASHHRHRGHEHVRRSVPIAWSPRPSGCGATAPRRAPRALGRSSHGADRRRAGGLSAVVTVSLALPVYNGERHLAETLDSLLAQEFDQFELLISDNGWTDATPDLVHAFAERDSRIVFRASRRRRCRCGTTTTWWPAAAAGTSSGAGTTTSAPDYLSRCVTAFDSFDTVVACAGRRPHRRRRRGEAPSTTTGSTPTCVRPNRTCGCESACVTSAWPMRCSA